MEAVGAGARDERAHARRRRNADRVREHDLRAAGEPRRELRDDAHVDRALERTAEADEIVTVAGTSAASTIASVLATASSSDALTFAVERLGRRKADVDTVEPGGGEALPPALVQHQPGELDAVAPLDGRDDLLRPGHLRYALVADEAHRLDPREAGGAEPVHELRAHGGRERLRLVLEPVPRPDVADRYPTRRA